MAGRMKEWLRQGQLVRVFALGHLCHPKVIEMLGLRGGWQAVWLDQEHAGLTQDQLEQGLRAARAAGLETFVRLAPTDYATVMRPLEAGAGGVMAAQVRGAAQAEEVVRWAKFAPRGVAVSRCLAETYCPSRNRSRPFRSSMVSHSRASVPSERSREGWGSRPCGLVGSMVQGRLGPWFPRVEQGRERDGGTDTQPEQTLA